MVKNWRYFCKGEDIGLLGITQHQYMTGNVIGIIAEKKSIIYEQGNMLNAKTWDVPIRIKLVDSFNRSNRLEVEGQISERIKELELEGCRCIISSGGYLAEFDNVFHQGEPIAMSTPLAILDFVLASISTDSFVCIFSEVQTDDLMAILRKMKFDESILERIVISNFKQFEYQHEEDKINRSKQIGAYIWDSIEDYHHFINVCNVPIYDFKKIAGIMINAVVQKPYEGVI